MLLPAITILMLVFTLSKNEGEQSSVRSTCEPYRLLIVWHTSCGENESFFQQRRFIVDLIRNVTDDTEILLTTVDTSLNYLIHIKKDSTNDTWMRTVGTHKPANLRNHTIPHVSIRRAVYRFLNQVGNQKISEEIFLVVNGNSVLSDKKRVKELLKYKITFVVFIGTNPPPKVWTNLATNKDHVFVLSDRLKESVTPVAEEIRNLSCQDSRLMCDTDEYWAGKRCYKCSHICSIVTKYPSKTCLEKCPYSAWDQYAKVAEDQSDARNQSLLVAILVTLLYICFLLTWIASYCFYKFWTKKTKTEQDTYTDINTRSKSD